MDPLPLELQQIILNQLDTNGIISYMMTNKTCLDIVKLFVRLQENVPYLDDHLKRNDLACFFASNDRANLPFLVSRATANGKVIWLMSIQKKYPDFDVNYYYQQITITRLKTLFILKEVAPFIKRERMAGLALRGRNREVMWYFANHIEVTPEIVTAAYMLADEKLIQLVETQYCYSCRRILALYGFIWSDNEPLFEKYFGKGEVKLEYRKEIHTFPIGGSSLSVCSGIRKNIIEFIVEDAIVLDREWAIRRICNPCNSTYLRLDTHFPICKAVVSGSYKVLELLLTQYYEKVTNVINVKCPSDILHERIYDLLEQCPRFTVTLRPSCYTRYKWIHKLHGKTISEFNENMRTLGEDALDYYEDLCDEKKELADVLNFIEQNRPSDPPDRRRNFIALFASSSRRLYHAIRYAIINRHLIAAKYLIAKFNDPTAYSEDYTMNDYFTMDLGIAQYSEGPIYPIDIKEEKNIDLMELLGIAIERVDIPVMRLLLPYAKRFHRIIRLESLREEAIPIIKAAGVKIRFTSLIDPYLLPPSVFESGILHDRALFPLIRVLIKRNYKSALATLERLYPEAVKKVQGERILNIRAQKFKPFIDMVPVRIPDYFIDL